METASQPNRESQGMKNLFHETKKTLLILIYDEMTDESVKRVLNTLTECEHCHESPPFSIRDGKDVTASLISVTAGLQHPKYHVNPNKLVIWLRRFMKAHNIDYVKDSYPEGVHFTPEETTDVSLKHRLSFLGLRGETQQQIQQSLALRRKEAKRRIFKFRAPYDSAFSM